MRWRGIIALAVLTAGSSALAQQSPSFGLERVAISAAAGEASSPSFGTRVVLAEQGPAGGMASVCGASWVQRSGVLSILAGGPVPIRLVVDRPSIDPLAIDLSWSGTDDTFDLRRVFDASTIGAPGAVVATISACAIGDASPTDSKIIYYLVLPAGSERSAP